MKRIALFIITTVLLNGCATFQPSIPKGYSGPTATIKDTSKSIDQGKANLFYLSHIDGKRIEDSQIQTLSASYGQGNFLRIVLLNNNVPAEEHVFTIVGRTEYGMPIRALIGTVLEVKGNISFSPIPNEAYIIKGRLSEEKSIIWIERVSNGDIIGEIKGTSKLGFFEK